MIDYQYQFNSHCVDWRMWLWIRANPRQPHVPLSAEQIENERAWSNFQSQLYYGWVKP